MKLSHEEFVVLMTRLRACYPNALADPGQWLATIAQYWAVIGPYDAAAVRRAFDLAWRVHAQWFPSAGQLAALVEEGERPPRMSALAAWAEVKKIASGSKKTHSDPVAQRAIELMGGGQALGQLPASEFDTWVRRRFESVYAECTAADARAEIAGRPVTALPDRIRKLTMGVGDGPRD